MKLRPALRRSVRDQGGVGISRRVSRVIRNCIGFFRWFLPTRLTLREPSVDLFPSDPDDRASTGVAVDALLRAP